MIPNAKKFEPGKSGNPGGRPKGIAAKAREHGDKALQVLADALLDDDAKTRIAAARELLDRGYGKPVTMTADVTNKLGDLDDDTLNSAIDALRSAIGASDETGGGAGAQTAH
jgi:HEAT repeat protein